MVRLNCWEFTGCGLQGRSSDGNGGLRGGCPAARERRLHGVHGGTNGGRSCWAILGTLCAGGVQTDMRKKYETCGKCDFYRVVKQQERGKLELTMDLLARLEF